MTAVPVHPLDATWLAALHRACFPDDPWDSAAWETLLRQPGVVGWALVDDEVPVGFVLARHVADEAEILTIGIVPGHRRRGGGALLLGHATANLPAGVDTLFLEVAADNPAAAALYAAAGFRPVGRRPGYYRRPAGVVDALLLSLVRANGLSDNTDSPGRTGHHGRETRKRV